jgi:hypothetical protein
VKLCINILVVILKIKGMKNGKPKKEKNTEKKNEKIEIKKRK